MLQLPILAYPALGAVSGLAVAGGKKLITGKADVARCVTALTIIAVAQAAFVLIAAAYGLIPATMVFSASLLLAGGILTKNIKSPSDFGNIAPRIVIGALVGGVFGYFGFVAIPPGSI